MPIDFKVRRDEYGYYVIAYRLVGNVEVRMETNQTIGMTLNLQPEDYAMFITDRFGADAEPKDRKMHFATLEAAMACRDGLRDLIPKAVRTGNLFLPQ